jgi:hypothetical protein
VVVGAIVTVARAVVCLETRLEVDMIRMVRYFNY